MRLTCFACGASASLDVALAHDGARAAVMIALQLPAPLGKLLVQYVGLFRPAQRQLSLDRLAALLGDLLLMINDGRVERGGRLWAAPQDAWKNALEEMLSKRDKLTLPLKNHAYLLTIIAGAANKVEAAAEVKTEASRASPSAARFAEAAPGLKRISMPEAVREQLSSITKGGKAP